MARRAYTYRARSWSAVARHRPPSMRVSRFEWPREVLVKEDLRTPDLTMTGYDKLRINDRIEGGLRRAGALQV